jgi:hypothetical protein
LDDLRDAYTHLIDSDRDAAVGQLAHFVDHLDDGSLEPTPRPRRWTPKAPVIAAAAVATLAISVSIATVQRHQGRSVPGPQVTAGNGSSLMSAQAQALRDWADFPVHASPRPIVLTGPDLLGPMAFATNNDKLAFLSGKFTLDTRLPTAPATVSGRAIITAAEALDVLRAASNGPATANHSLQIVEVHLTSTRFATDRGPTSLPAWSFGFAGVATPAYVLAMPAHDRWPHGTVPVNRSDSTARLAPDDRHVTLTFFGGPAGTGPCAVSYTVDVAATSSAVLLTLTGVNSGATSSRNVGCTLEARERTLTFDIGGPLGNRVLIDANGAPIPVTRN